MIDDCIGKLLGMQHTRGHTVPLDALEVLGTDGAKGLVANENALKNSGLRLAPLNERSIADNKVLKKFTGDGSKNAAGIFYSMRNPSGIFGEEMIRPVSEFEKQIFSDYKDSLKPGSDEYKAARREYKSGIKDVFDDIDTSHLTEAQQILFEGYQRFYEGGGVLFNKGEKNPFQNVLSNVTGNVLKSSPTVLLGNILEGAIKLPTLYPKTFLPALSKAIEGGLFKEIQEAADAGVYGLHYAGEEKSGWQGIIGVTDIPLKNIAWHAGELAGHGGDLAVQRVAFVPRFGDLPSVYYSNSGRNAVSLLGYTVNSYKMYANLFKMAKQGNWQPLLTYHALAALIGGGATAAIPAPVQSLIQYVAPDSKQWFDEQQGPLASLIQPSNITRLGVPYDIAGSQNERAGKDFNEGAERLRSGDMTGAWDMVMGTLKLSSLTDLPIGDANLQKLLELAGDTARQDDEAVDKDLKRLNPIKIAQ